MSEKIYDVPAAWAKKAWLNDAKYKKMYAASIKDPDKFWGEHGKRVAWFKHYSKVSPTTASTGTSRPAPSSRRSPGKPTTPANPRRSPTGNSIPRSASSPTS